MQQLIRPFLHLFPLLAALLLGALLLPAANASPALNVTLVYFRGQGLDNAARLEWRTVSEENTAGYKIERAGEENGAFEYLSEIGIIEARGSVSTGDTYDAVDNTAQNGQIYWYRLIEIEFDNSERVLHTTRVEVAPPPTPEPVGGGSEQQENTPVPTSTSAATSTPAAGSNGDDDNNGNGSATPTATRTGNQATNTPAASATPGSRPTNTPPPPPTRMTFNNTNDDDIAEAAGATTEGDVIAQVTPGTGPYPGPNDNGDNTDSEEAYPAAPTPENGNELPAAPLDSYPPGSGGGNAGDSDSSAVGSGRAVGSDTGSAEGQEAQQEEGSVRSRILLWAGFIVALLVFAAGVAFAIMLSTRQRHNNP